MLIVFSRYIRTIYQNNIALVGARLSDGFRAVLRVNEDLVEAASRFAAFNDFLQGAAAGNHFFFRGHTKDSSAVWLSAAHRRAWNLSDGRRRTATVTAAFTAR